MCTRNQHLLNTSDDTVRPQHRQESEMTSATHSETCRDTRHNYGNEVIEIAVGGNVELECSEADIVQSFVVDAERLIGVLNKLMNR